MERPFDYNQFPTYTPTRPDPAIGTLTRKMWLATHTRLNEAKRLPGRPDLARLCRICNYLFRRERRLNPVQYLADGGAFPIAN
jgi:hypothetical protein